MASLSSAELKKLSQEERVTALGMRTEQLRVRSMFIEFGENADEHIKAVAKIAEETRTLLSPIVGLAIRTNPDKKEKYAEKGRRKEELMSEIIQLINAESKARAEAAAASRKDNQSKKSE